MIWEFGLACFLPSRQLQNKDEKHKGKEEEINNNLEHNKAWLLAESGAQLTNADPQSVHSSFRFSFCSQTELESMNVTNPSSSATVLTVNLDNGLVESGSRELKWQRIESIERSISPVAHSLIRFSYAQILFATRNLIKKSHHDFPEFRLSTGEYFLWRGFEKVPNEDYWFPKEHK